MFNFLERVKLGIKEKREMMVLQTQKKEEIRELRKKKEHEKLKTGLEREEELEKIRAEIRKSQAIAKPKEVEQQKVKSGFDKFRDYCTDFANKPSAFGDMKLNIGGINGKKNKRNSKRSGQ